MNSTPSDVNHVHDNSRHHAVNYACNLRRANQGARALLAEFNLPSVVRRRVGRRSATSFPYKYLRGTFTKEVVLLQDQSVTKVPKAHSRLFLHKNGHVISAAEFEKDWSEEQVERHIYQLFPKLHESSFEILKSLNSNLVRPVFESKTGLDGMLLSKLFKSKVVYIRPSSSMLASPDAEEVQELQQLNDMSNVTSGELPSISTSLDPVIPLQSTRTSDTLENRASAVLQSVPLFSPLQDSPPRSVSRECGQTFAPLQDCTRTSASQDIVPPFASLQDSTSRTAVSHEGSPTFAPLQQVHVLSLQERSSTSAKSRDSVFDFPSSYDCLFYDATLSDDIEETVTSNIEQISLPIQESLKVEDVLQDLRRTVENCKDVTKFNINRQEVWECAKRGFGRKAFKPTNNFDVKFSDDDGKSEGAVDLGGPKRELLTLLMRHLRHSTIFEDTDVGRMLGLNRTYVEGKDYYFAGLAISCTLIHGGPSPMFLSPILYEALVNDPDNCKVTTENVHDMKVKSALLEFQTASAEDKSSLLETNPLDVLCELSGCPPLARSHAESQKLATRLATWFVLGRTRESIEQFKQGLANLNVLTAIQQHPHLFQPIFCLNKDNVDTTARTFEDIFVINRSEQVGSNSYTVENRVITYFRDFLLDIEEESAVLNLAPSQALTFANLLMFATGSESVPPLGFDPKPSIAFMHGDESKFPKGNTCACILQLPVVHMTYSSFKHHMLFGVLNTNGFGYA